MDTVSVVRLYVLRAMYLFLAVGLGVYLWPGILGPHRARSLAEGEVACMLGAFSILCLVGLRYPLQMLPVLLWEALWKTLWFVLVPFPQWRAGHVQPSLQPAIVACSLVVLVYLTIPWGYVFRRYVRVHGDRWR